MRFPEIELDAAYGGCLDHYHHVSVGAATSQQDSLAMVVQSQGFLAMQRLECLKYPIRKGRLARSSWAAPLPIMAPKVRMDTT